MILINIPHLEMLLTVSFLIKVILGSSDPCVCQTRKDGVYFTCAANELRNFNFASIEKKLLRPQKDANLTDLCRSTLKEPNTIRILNLGHNLLEIIYVETFQNFTELRTLNLDHNRISRIHSQAFFDLQNLKYLQLSHNRLHSVEQGWLQPLESLTKLDINDNQIREFKPDNIKWPASLTSINLANNSIDRFPPLPLESRYRDAEWNVHLEGNNLYCNCRRAEHTKSNLDLHTYCKISSNCNEVTATGTTGKKNISCEKEIQPLWQKYTQTSICMKPNLKMTATVDVKGIFVGCEAKGYPPYTLKVERNDNVSSSFKTTNIHSNHSNGIYEMHMTVGPVKPGKYTCRASSDIKTWVSEDFQNVSVSQDNNTLFITTETGATKGATSNGSSQTGADKTIPNA